MIGSEEGKIKRPEIKRYVAPALRDKFNQHLKEKMECTKDNYASEASNRQTYFSEYRVSSRITSNIALNKVRYNSSGSSYARNTSDESYKDYDSSDFEECCSVSAEVMHDEETSMETNEKTSTDQWNIELSERPETNNHAIEAENYQTNTEIPNRILPEHDPDVESLAHQLQDIKTDTERDKRLFYSSDESSISSIEALIDNHLKTEGTRVRTSTPCSDIDEPKVVDAAKFDSEEEIELETTLLSQSETATNTNRNKCDCNFEIYQDPSSVMDQSNDFTKIFGSNYIPPPIPRPKFTYRLPPIHRLPVTVSSANVPSSSSQVPSQNRQQLFAQLENPRSLYPPSLQWYSSVQLYSPFIPTNSSGTRSVLSLGPSRASNPPYRHSSIPPIPPPQERFNSPCPLQNVSNPPHFDQRGLNVQGLESNELEEFFYIPPPVPLPQHTSRVHQIRNLNQRLNVQSPAFFDFVDK